MQESCVMKRPLPTLTVCRSQHFARRKKRSISLRPRSLATARPPRVRVSASMRVGGRSMQQQAAGSGLRWLLAVAARRSASFMQCHCSHLSALLPSLDCCCSAAACWLRLVCGWRALGEGRSRSKQQRQKRQKQASSSEASGRPRDRLTLTLPPFLPPPSGRSVTQRRSECVSEAGSARQSLQRARGQACSMREGCSLSTALRLCC